MDMFNHYHDEKITITAIMSVCFKGQHMNARGIAGLGLAVAGLVVEIGTKVSPHQQRI